MPPAEADSQRLDDRKEALAPDSTGASLAWEIKNAGFAMAGVGRVIRVARLPLCGFATCAAKKEGADCGSRRPSRRYETPNRYIFFSEHIFFVSSHVPPALSQSALVVAFVTSPPYAGPVAASARATASIESRPSMTFLPYACTGACQDRKNVSPRIIVPSMKVLPAPAVGPRVCNELTGADRVRVCVSSRRGKRLTCRFVFVPPPGPSLCPWPPRSLLARP